MSKSSKLNQKQKNLLEKRKRKLANRARYAELARLGQNSKSKRSISNKKANKKTTIDHPDGNCGNIACKKCDPCGVWRKRRA